MSIARAILLDPPILVLDDSTSSVDARTENEIRKAMASVMRGRTTFIIAHRLSTVHSADMIVVLQDGEIVERGNHTELVKHGGLYREIYDLQLRPQEEVPDGVRRTCEGRSRESDIMMHAFGGRPSGASKDGWTKRSLETP